MYPYHSDDRPDHELTDTDQSEEISDSESQNYDNEF